EYLAHIHGQTAGAPPALDLALERAVQAATRGAIAEGLAVAAHDTSEGGFAVALAESCIAGGVGGRFDIGELWAGSGERIDVTLFGEAASRVLLQAAPGNDAALERYLRGQGVPLQRLGVAEGDWLEIGDL